MAATRAVETAASNSLMGMLLDLDRASIEPALERADRPPGAVLFEPGDDVTHVYFPTAGVIVGLVIPLQDGRMVEAATVGQEGAIGGIVSLGRKPAFSRAVVQVAGPLFRLDVNVLERSKTRSPLLHDLFARYADCLLAQIMQSVACNAMHSLEARCARWLLAMHDRVPGDELPLTQDFLAQMLGAPRTYVTRTEGELRKRDLIDRRRGHVVVVDRQGLEEAACGCYRSVRLHFERVLLDRE